MDNNRIRRHTRWVWLALGIGILLAWLVYAVIFMQRIHLDKRAASVPNIQPLARDEPQEEWYAIYQNGRRAGYSHMRMFSEEKGYSLTEELFLRLNFLEEIQDVFSTVEAHLARDFSLRSFSFRLQAGLIAYRLNGVVEKGALVLASRMAGEQQTTEIPLSSPIYLGSGIKSYIVNQPLKVGDTHRLELFDPATLSRTMVPLQVEATETINVRSRNLEAYRVVMEFHGTKLRSWISPYGELLKEEGFLGMTLVRTDGEDALKGLTEANAAELTRRAAVATDRVIAEPRKLKQLRLQLTGITGSGWHLAGGRQAWRDGELTVVRESLERLPPVKIPQNGPELVQDLQPTFLVQSDAPALIQQAADIVGEERDALRAAEKISAWVHQNLEKRPTLSIPNALDVWRRRSGDCNEHSVLFAALARAGGIPTRVVAGLLYVDGRFFYHAWNEVHVGEWVAVDSLLDQIPADPTHIRFIIGGLEHQVRLVRLLGRLEIRVLDYE